MPDFIPSFSETPLKNQVIATKQKSQDAEIVVIPLPIMTLPTKIKIDAN